MIGALTVDNSDGHKRGGGVGAASPINFQYHLKLKEYPPQLGVWRHVRAIPQCHEMITSYRAVVFSQQDPAAFDPRSENRALSPVLAINSTNPGLSFHVHTLISHMSRRIEHPPMPA